MRILWVLPILGSLAAALVILMTFAGSNGAPQEAAGFSLACALAVVPYVLVRAITAMAALDLHDQLERIIAALHTPKP